jgi:hypothetical protein
MALLSTVFFGCAGSVAHYESAPIPPPPLAADERPAPTIYYPHEVRRAQDTALRRKLVVGFIPFVSEATLEGDTDRATTRPTLEQATRENFLRQTLRRELLESGAFVVVERDDLIPILREIEFGESRFVSPETRPEVGEIIAVQYLLNASIGPNQDPTFKESVEPLPRYDELSDAMKVLAVDRGVVLARIQELRRLRLRAAHAVILAHAYPYSAYLSLYSVRTSEVAAEAFGIGATLLDALRDAVEELVDACAEIAPPPRIAYVDGERVFIDLGSDDGVGVGQRFRYVWEGPAIRNTAGQVIGHDSQEGGLLEVTRVEPLMSVAQVVERVREPGVGDRVEKQESAKGVPGSP